VSLRLLIADDNATARRLLRALLESHQGWEVCGEGENGLEAVAKAGELKPDLIILDLAMPVMDGLHAAQRISATSPTVPILMYTMHNFAGLELEMKKVGVRKVINKTASGDALLLAIKEALNAAAPQAGARLPQEAGEANACMSNAANDPASAKEPDSNPKPN
jgi:DNA-binding NarL/FixJ family response regulator